MTQRQFCIQHHIAKRAGPHDDFRFEDGGVAVSFCLPKGMKRHSRPVLAIRVEDHELSYMDFEGTTRDGIGTVELKARGELELLEWSDGKILRARLDDGIYTFIKPKTGEANYWLLLPVKAG